MSARETAAKAEVPSAPEDGLGPAATGAWRGAPEGARVGGNALLGLDVGELDLEYEPAPGILWCYQRHTERPNFTPALLRDVRAVQRAIERRFADGASRELRWLVWGSRLAGVFNLGGDLEIIAALVRKRDAEGLESYARACIDICYPNAINLSLPIVTVALVQGTALGGGLEAALSSDLIVAERSAKFGFPEILFNLFPGMGAYSLLARRLGASEAERMIFSGRIFGADELQELGLIDVLADDGKGEAALYEHIARLGRAYRAHRALYDVRRRFAPLAYRELEDIMTIWVETALGLNEADVRKMERLATIQQKRLSVERAAARSA